MRILLHGGNCCGVKHITDLGSYPDVKLAARNKAIDGDTSFGAYSSWNGALNDMRSKHMGTADKDFFNEAAPKESYARRLSRFIAFLKEKRPHGIVEIVINEGQKIRWHNRLIRRGFKLVTEGQNSNTLHTLYVYHLSY